MCSCIQQSDTATTCNRQIFNQQAAIIHNSSHEQCSGGTYRNSCSTHKLTQCESAAKRLNEHAAILHGTASERSTEGQHSDCIQHSHIATPATSCLYWARTRGARLIGLPQLPTKAHTCKFNAYEPCTTVRTVATAAAAPRTNMRTMEQWRFVAGEMRRHRAIA